MEANDHPHSDSTATPSPINHRGQHAGEFLRSRLSQWVMRAGGLRVNLMPPRVEAAMADTAARAAADEAKSGLDTAKPDKTTASRNAQNCTFEVF